MEHQALIRSASLYDRLERAIIALEYALADARSCQFDELQGGFGGIAKSQEALESAGREVQDVLVALKASALQAAALRVSALAC